MSVKPKTILDLGIGHGKYGYLCREYLELWTTDKNKLYDERDITIDGVEIFQEYITSLQQQIYDTIYVDNILHYLENYHGKVYDLILLIDVLEHMNRNKGKEVIAGIKKTGKNIIISTPVVMGKQDMKFGNPFEKHICEWSMKQLQKQFPRAQFFSRANSLIMYSGAKEVL